MSLRKNSPNEDTGKFLAYPWPRCCVRALSFTRENVVLTKNTANSFEIAGSSHEIT